MPDFDKYEAVIGLEVHTQLLTKSKLFCGDSTAFGNPPNTNVSAISLAHPGTLPVMNEKAVELAIRLGLAFNCDISQDNFFARKNYFYPDLPKGYQMSQHTTPICKNGFVPITVNEQKRDILRNRIHLEEDAGKTPRSAARGESELTGIHPRGRAQSLRPGRLRRRVAAEDRQDGEHRAPANPLLFWH